MVAMLNIKQSGINVFTTLLEYLNRISSNKNINIKAHIAKVTSIEETAIGIVKTNSKKNLYSMSFCIIT